VMAIVFFLFTRNKKPEVASQRTVLEMLRPLRNTRVWRFGLYYFLVFGGFVALAQWLVPYYVNVYSMTIVTAGLLTSIFSLPSGLIRAFGGYLSDRVGARTVMYWVLGAIAVCCLALFFPKMEVESPGSGVMARKSGAVTLVTENEIRVDQDVYALRPPVDSGFDETRTHILPVIQSWHVPQVTEGQVVSRKTLLATGTTHIFFQANVWIFTMFVFIIGIAYFPTEVAVVGGAVGVMGGLGGFFCPIIFGYLLRGIGLWTTTWIFFFFVTLVCLIWLHITVKRITRRETAIEAIPG